MGNTPGENKEGSSEQPHNSNDSAVKNIIDKSKAEIILL